MRERPEQERINIADLRREEAPAESIADVVRDREFSADVGFTNPGSQTDLVGAEPLAGSGDVGVNDPGGATSRGGRDQADVGLGGADQPRHESAALTHGPDDTQHESAALTQDERSGGSSTSW